jgi:ABC-2 type transport system permease protein
MIAAGLLLGWRWHAGLDAALAAVGLLLLLRFALLWVGIFMGLIAKGPESVAAVQILVWPISFLSNVFVDPATMPSWLGTIAQWNPLSVTASATRALFMNPGWQGSSWVSENAWLLAIVWPVLLIAIFLPLSVRKYRRLSR